MRALVIGASGGIDGALADGLESRGSMVTRLSRGSAPAIDLASDASIEAAAAALARHAPFDVILVASGMLHGDGLAPEKTYRQLEGPALEPFRRGSRESNCAPPKQRRAPARRTRPPWPGRQRWLLRLERRAHRPLTNPSCRACLASSASATTFGP